MSWRALFQEIGDDLFGPARAQWAKNRQTWRDYLELRRVLHDEKAAERLRHRGYINDAGLLALYRAMIDKLDASRGIPPVDGTTSATKEE